MIVIVGVPHNFRVTSMAPPSTRILTISTLNTPPNFFIDTTFFKTKNKPLMFQKRFPLAAFSELHFKTDACIKISLQIQWLIECIENFNMCTTSPFDSYLICILVHIIC